MSNPYGYAPQEPDASEVDHKMIQYLARAIHHAREVSGRDCTNALTIEERANRVGIFVTSLRREIPAAGGWGSIRTAVATTKLWHDIGKCKEPVTGYLGGRFTGGPYAVTEDRLHHWLYAAKMVPMDMTDIIDEELRELESMIPVLQVHINQAERINVEADGVVEKLAGIFDTDD